MFNHKWKTIRRLQFKWIPVLKICDTRILWKNTQVYATLYICQSVESAILHIAGGPQQVVQ
jgi:homoserine trans-succinylase